MVVQRTYTPGVSRVNRQTDEASGRQLPKRSIPHTCENLEEVGRFWAHRRRQRAHHGSSTGPKQRVHSRGLSQQFWPSGMNLIPSLPAEDLALDLLDDHPARALEGRGAFAWSPSADRLDRVPRLDGQRVPTLRRGGRCAVRG